MSKDNPNKLSGLWRRYITASVVLDKPTPYVKIHGIDEFNAAVAQLLLEARIEELELTKFAASAYSDSSPFDLLATVYLPNRLAELKALGTNQ